MNIIIFTIGFVGLFLTYIYYGRKYLKSKRSTFARWNCHKIYLDVMSKAYKNNKFIKLEPGQYFGVPTRNIMDTIKGIYVTPYTPDDEIIEVAFNKVSHMNKREAIKARVLGILLFIPWLINPFNLGNHD